MAAERNAALVRRVIDEIWNAGDLELADVLFAPTYVNHLGVVPDLVQGPEAIKFSVALYRAAFPYLHVGVDDLVTDGDTVVLHWTASNMPPTSTPPPNVQPGMVTGTTRSYVVGDQVAESWTSWDAASALERLDVLKPTESLRHRGVAKGHVLPADTGRTRWDGKHRAGPR